MSVQIDLRQVEASDLPFFFQFQLDPDANRMAAFTAKDPSDRAAFDAHWERILTSETVLIRTIVCDGEVAGSVLSYVMEDTPEVSYWIGKPYWGKGIATEALKQFLEIQAERPIYARVACDNTGSIRVLEKCEFIVQRTESGYANARGSEIDEFVMVLE